MLNITFQQQRRQDILAKLNRVIVGLNLLNNKKESYQKGLSSRECNRRKNNSNAYVK